MISHECLGFRAESVVAWLAATGATVLDERLRLHWTADAAPFAVLSSNDVNPIDAILESWPDTAQLEDMPIAQRWRQTESMERNVSVEAFRERAQMARGHHHSWTLSSTMTDLHIREDGTVAHGPFDPSGPGTIKWLHHRLMRLDHRPSSGELEDSLAGQAARVQGNGLGFDHARLGSLADKTAIRTDPVAEVLAFYGLALFPVRGAGVDERQRTRERPRQRGWRQVGEGTARHFAWPAWSQPLDRAGIDALLDVWNPTRKAGWPRLGIQSAWQTVEYKSRDRSDPTKAYGSERL